LDKGRKFEMKAVIAAGNVSDEALRFLRIHGAHIDTHLGISMIELPEDANVSRSDCRPSEYAVEWYDEDGNDPSEWIEVHLDLDASKTIVCLKKARVNCEWI
jgi:hypothetical protein